jgi:hypothetical protein
MGNQNAQNRAGKHAKTLKKGLVCESKGYGIAHLLITEE